MSAKSFICGRNHGLQGVYYLAHRFGKRYKSSDDNADYKRGYLQGGLKRASIMGTFIASEKNELNRRFLAHVRGRQAYGPRQSANP